jgi:rhodanese-related sulfurtransferase
VRRILLEGLVVAVVGAALAFAANALSPRGLQLTRNYFPAPALPLGVTNPAPAVAGSPTPSVTQLLSARLAAEGLHLADSNLVARLFHDPRRDQDGVVFVDARDDEHYQEGHIPGAYQLDYYHPADYLATALQVCQIAQQVVVYCNGGNCEDSEFAATLLRDAGVGKDKLFVYGGGMTEWNTNGWPVELGPRNSGRMREAKR